MCYYDFKSEIVILSQYIENGLMKKNKQKEYKAIRPAEEKRYSVKHTRAKRKKYGAKDYIFFFLRVLYRILLIVVALAFIAVFGAFKTLNTVAHGPSETFRDFLVQSAMQASATKWVPGLFLSDEEVDNIVNASGVKVVEEVDPMPAATGDDVTGPVLPYGPGEDGPQIVDISDGIEFHHDAAPKYNAIAAINAGEFQDTGGVGLGERPIGLTYSKGKCVWDDGRKRTFIGIDSNNRLICREGMTRAEADAIGIRDAVSFQTKNVLIETTEDGTTVCYYAPDNKGKAQRTAIGQRADGKFIFIVTDGRSASSIGATYDDVIDMMIKYGAVTAGMLDGGSSAMMYYSNYVSKYNVDESELDEYQKMGLVNKYKAFTRPRYLPTFFMVEP